VYTAYSSNEEILKFLENPKVFMGV
jgi:hypothetical protein